MRGRAISIRFKVFFLSACILGMSLAACLWVGTSFLVQDKVSYIYDFVLGEVGAASDAIEGRIRRLETVVRMLAADVDRLGSPGGIGDVALKDLESSGLLLLRPDGSGRFRTLLELGERAKQLREIAEERGWTPQEVERGQILVGSVSAGQLAVAGRAVDGKGLPLAFVGFLPIRREVFNLGGGGARLTLLDSLGRSVLLDSEEGKEPSVAELAAFGTDQLRLEVDSAVREIPVAGSPHIAAFRKLARGHLMVVGSLPKEVAFVGVRILVRRTLLVGGGILLIAMGLSVLTVRRLLAGLKQLWNATNRVAEGDFAVRVPPASGARDEIGDLASSFNMMAGRIGELMVATAEKARMEKELETAQLVQQRFFPRGAFESPNLKLAGRCRPASECGGDWWQYDRIGDLLILVMGDVTGHGVSSALVTAAVYGLFAQAMALEKERSEGTFDLCKLLATLNAGVLSAAGGQATMSLIAAEISLRTGRLRLSNASHRPPYWIRRSVRDPIVPLLGALSSPLGQGADTKFELEEVDLGPGDMVFLYTDGLVEPHGEQGRVLRKSRLFKLLLEQAGASQADPDRICETVLGEAVSIFQEDRQRQEDDITVVSITVPSSAVFVRGAGREEIAA